MRDRTTYRAYRRNMIRNEARKAQRWASKSIRFWRDGPHYDIRHNVMRWIREADATGVMKRIFTAVTRRQTIHHTYRTSMEQTR